jgi:hypothetical protein
LLDQQLVLGAKSEERRAQADIEGSMKEAAHVRNADAAQAELDASRRDPVSGVRSRTSGRSRRSHG